jgi:hypothetical protein
MTHLMMVRFTTGSGKDTKLREKERFGGIHLTGPIGQRPVRWDQFDCQHRVGSGQKRRFRIGHFRRGSVYGVGIDFPFSSC